MEIADTVSRFVQLAWEGWELRGECPGCGLLRLVVSPLRQLWRCYGCGEHEFADDSADGFARFARACGLKEGEPIEPLRIPIRIGRWERVIPPTDSRPNWSLPWLGEALDAQELRNERGERAGFRVTYSKAGPMLWVYVLYGSDNRGCWKVQRPPIRERLAIRYPEMPGMVARLVQGRVQVRIGDFLRGGKPCSYEAQAAAHAIRALGWIHKREGSGTRRRYYVRAP